MTAVAVAFESDPCFYLLGGVRSLSSVIFFSVTRMQTPKGDGGWVIEKHVASKACVLFCVANGLLTGPCMSSSAVLDPLQTLRAVPQPRLVGRHSKRAICSSGVRATVKFQHLVAIGIYRQRMRSLAWM